MIFYKLEAQTSTHKRALEIDSVNAEHLLEHVSLFSLDFLFFHPTLRQTLLADLTASKLRCLMLFELPLFPSTPLSSSRLIHSCVGGFKVHWLVVFPHAFPSTFSLVEQKAPKHL